MSCLANNQTADLKQCGVDTIPFAEEKCNTFSCEEATVQPTTEVAMVEVCEEVEVEVDDEEEEATATTTEKMMAVTEAPAKETIVAKEEMEVFSGSGSPESLGVSMSAEGSGEIEAESVIF